MPDDYPLFQAARWLGVPPWELEERPTRYQNRALAFADAEAQAERDIQRRRSERQGGR